MSAEVCAKSATNRPVVCWSCIALHATLDVMNRVQLIGDLVWPVEVWRDPATGRRFGRAMLAVSVGEFDLTFVPLILQDREAVDAARYLGEGSRVEVAAHLHSTLVTDRNLIGR